MGGLLRPYQHYVTGRNGGRHNLRMRGIKTNTYVHENDGRIKDKCYLKHLKNQLHITGVKV